MSKQWKTIPTINDSTIKTTTTERQKSTTINKLMKTTPTRDIEKLKEHSEKLFEAQKNEDAKLLDAFANKKLKSKAAIKKALGLAKKTNDAGKKSDKAADPQDNIAVEEQ